MSVEPGVCFDVCSSRFWRTGVAMTDENYERKLAELDDLINNPNMPLSPSRIWQILGEISGHAGRMTSMDQDQCVAAE